jgi:hypothetical protein
MSTKDDGSGVVVMAIGGDVNNLIMSSNNKKFDVSVTYDPFVIALSHVTVITRIFICHLFIIIKLQSLLFLLPAARFLSLPSLLYDTTGIVHEGEAVRTMARVNLEVS